jgi:hypothetical protein
MNDNHLCISTAAATKIIDEHIAGRLTSTLTLPKRWTSMERNEKNKEMTFQLFMLYFVLLFSKAMSDEEIITFLRDKYGVCYVSKIKIDFKHFRRKKESCARKRKTWGQCYGFRLATLQD